GMFSFALSATWNLQLGTCHLQPQPVPRGTSPFTLPATWNPQLGTCNLQPATCHLPPATCHLNLLPVSAGKCNFAGYVRQL
ncbi:MAG TPA: hypothetical protein VK166_07005, partial [Chitinophagaceae bacterium]|nr:hypothetical protein [Chitinophagaceae bacterium]